MKEILFYRMCEVRMAFAEEFLTCAAHSFSRSVLPGPELEPSPFDWSNWSLRRITTMFGILNSFHSAERALPSLKAGGDKSLFHLLKEHPSPVSLPWHPARTSGNLLISKAPSSRAGQSVFSIFLEILQIGLLQGDFSDGWCDQQEKSGWNMLDMSSRRPCWPWIHPCDV